MDREAAFKKVIHFCEYQERSRQEVEERLLEWNVSQNLIPSIIEELEKSNFLNERRFAIEYSHGKFKSKGWGRIRIRQGLLRKGISKELIEEGLRTIDPDEYFQKISSLINKKLDLVESENELEKNHKVARYILSYGFEPELIWKILKQEEI
jgi:regulatory protein